MGIGTSLGAYFETELDHHSSNEYLDKPNSTPDNNELSTNEVMPKPGEEPKITQANFLTDFFKSKDKVTQEDAPALKHYPTDDDAKEAIKYGFGYGSGNEPFINDEAARILGYDSKDGFKPVSGEGFTLKELTAAAADERTSKVVDLNKVSNWGEKEALGFTFAKAALAVNRNPIAAVGFDPSKIAMDVVTKNGTLGGGYSKSKDATYSVLDSTSNAVHESIHRGLNILSKESPKAKEYLSKLPDEEMLVRYMMYKHAGDPEGKQGDIDAQQRDSGIKIFESIAPHYQVYLNGLMSEAEEYIKNKRPRGPK